MKAIIGVIFLVFAIIIGMTAIEKDRAVFYHSLNGSEINDQNVSNSFLESEEKIEVTISGQIEKPGTYEVESGCFLDDVISKAGGITSTADTDCFDFYLILDKNISIYIPPISNDIKVSINEADLDNLMTLTGIGKVIGGRIITYREENGPITYLEQLLEVDGIGKSLFYKIRDNICL